MANRSLHQINFARLIAKSENEKQINQLKKTTTHTSSVYIDKNIIQNKSNKIKSTSLFFKYYEEKLNNWKKKDDSKRKKDNIFYSPHLFKSIQNRLYIMPLWSSVMVGELMQKTYSDLELKYKEFLVASAQSSKTDRDRENITTVKKLEKGDCQAKQPKLFFLLFLFSGRVLSKTYPY